MLRAAVENTVAAAVENTVAAAVDTAVAVENTVAAAVVTAVAVENALAAVVTAVVTHRASKRERLEHRTRKREQLRHRVAMKHRRSERTVPLAPAVAQRRQPELPVGKQVQQKAQIGRRRQCQDAAHLPIPAASLQSLQAASVA
jgi:C4-dicarboxylate-specific signal transduction histidine kinase